MRGSISITPPNGLRSDEIGVVLLRDRIVECQVRIRCLQDQALDPLAALVIKKLKSSEYIPLDVLATELSISHPASLRVLSEVLSILVRANEIKTRTSGRVIEFAITTPERWTEEGASETIIDQQFQYLPRSKQLASFIPGCTLDEAEKQASRTGINFWDPTDYDELYPRSIMIDALNRACASYYRNRKVFQDLGEQDVRNEILQRSRILEIGMAFLDSSVVTLSILDRWNLHTCFVHRVSALKRREWSAVVVRYPRGSVDYDYTEYFRSRWFQRGAPESLLDAACI